MSGSSPLVTLIRNHLQRYGPAPFPWFMEQALYHPDYGYYASTRTRIGRQGDYYTNVSVGRLYGELLASQLIEMWKLIDSPSRFTIVEEGAEDGQMAIDSASELVMVQQFDQQEFHDAGCMMFGPEGFLYCSWPDSY